MVATVQRSTHDITVQQLALPMAIEDADSSTPAVASHERLGFELGWDYAHHGLTPPVDQLFRQSPLQHGWQLGRATFGSRTLRTHRHTQLWLSLRLHAWQRGRQFETLLVTPNYLQQLDTTHCPISRLPLTDTAQDPQQRTVDRVRDDAGYAAGNLAVISRAANAAKADRNWQQAWAMAQSLRQGPMTVAGGLQADGWERMAVLASFVTEVPHDLAAQLPMVVLPPNRLRLFNPIQALQALVTRQLATPGWSQRLTRLEALLSDDARADFSRFVLALVPRVLQCQSLSDPMAIRWALEDAWRCPLLQKRWTRFALRLNPQQAEQLVQRAAHKRLSTVRVQSHGIAATEGWALERQGYREVA
ncbi:hypothetical protein SAMN05216359_103368 [Roseateles sp. YR242]|uniref:hypothetical protein n=1 Tax=Roseateles sp. YR242 TaxID=1855305 RepID=UPI0008BEDC9D|nr:hypothetical protein [Roseateles sp. YR242]SEK85970.1 hypothetical protein SAMN05216359_103368 [Roseateles sp. YR242]